MDMINVIEFKDKKMKYLKFGSGTNIMIMIPGLSVKSVIDSSNMIIDAYKMFDSNYTTYLFERMDVPNIYSMNDIAKDIFDSIDYLGLKDLYVFGASQGGMISILLYLLNKKNVKKIVMASSNFNIPSYSEKILGEWISYAENKEKEKLVLGFAKYVYPKEVLEKHKDMFISLANSLTSDDLSMFISKATALIGFDIRNEIDKIEVPIFIVNDKKDNLLRYSDIIKNVTDKPNFTYHSYNDMGHALYDLEKDFKNLMLDFFNK